MVENAAEGILTVASDGTVLSFNAAAETMFGWSAAEIVGRPVATIVTAELHDAIAQFLDTWRSDGATAAHSKDVEISGVTRDGSQFPMMISTSAISAEGSSQIISAIVRDLSDQKRLEAQLTYQALHDPLTGLPNRTMLTDRLNQALARVRRHHRMCATLYVDLDRFKVVNDTLGHAVGDHLIIEAASRIKATVREIDTVARLGGDEFVVLCEDIEGVHDASELAGRVIDVLRAPFRVGADEPIVSASIGIALSADGIEPAERMLANADTALYRAKSNGRNCYQLFDETMQSWVAHLAALEGALRQALPNGELVLHYQPIVEAEPRLIRGFEALLRWQRPGFGLVAPNAFIPTAEETGLILEIGSWVLDEACRNAAEWARRWPDRHLGIAVNVSSRQLVAGDIVEVVSNALARSGLDPTLLTLELIESTLIEDAVAVEPYLRELRAIGVSLALDDFGTGYSSLSYLRAFPFNVVKIDKSFIRTIGIERGDMEIVSAVIGLAESLGLEVVAEGVETSDQLAVLQRLSCHKIQGDLFARPQPIEQLAALLEKPTLWSVIPGERKRAPVR